MGVTILELTPCDMNQVCGLFWVSITEALEVQLVRC